MLYFTPRNHTEKNMFVFLPADSQKNQTEDLRVGADELDMRQLDPCQSVCPPMPDRKQRSMNVFVSIAQTLHATHYDVQHSVQQSCALEVQLGT